MPDITSHNLIDQLSARKDAVNEAVLVTAGFEDLEDIESEINTVGKYNGKQVWDPDTSRLVIASGGNPSNDWVNPADGLAVYTPV